jgi:hypothetical protein
MRNINRIERTGLFVFALLLILILSGIGYSGYVSRVTTWSSSQVLTAGALNAEFDNVLDNGVGVSTTQTLTNKTLTAPTISAPTITGGTITTPTINTPTITTPTEVFGTYSSSEINGTTLFDGNVSGTAIQDDDTFANATSLKLASSASIKNYIDSTTTFGGYTTKTNGVDYLASTDGTVTAWATHTCLIRGYTDSAATPTTERARDQHTATVGSCGIAMDVKNGDYWRVDISGHILERISWMPK